MSTLAERLLSGQSNYQPSDKRWVTFLKDHRATLLANSTKITLDPQKMNTFRYHLTELLREYSQKPDLAWIVKWLNQIKGEWEVVELEYLLVPTDSTLDSLWDKYKSAISKRKDL